MMFQAELYKIPKAEAKKRMAKLIKDFELTSYLKYPISSYSGGIKRRLDIECGKTNTNIIGKLFFVIDQIDSLIGVMLILVIFAKISWKQYFAYIFIGGFTHIMVNLFLYKIKVRRNV